MKKIHKIATVMFVLIASFSSQSMSATATNVKCNGCVASSDIKNNSVTSKDIKNSTITSSDIKNSTITSSDIKNSTIKSNDLKDGAVNFDKLGPDVQVILDTVEDSDTRITALEQGIPATNFSGYGLPFSAIGAPVNVIVLRRDNGDGSFGYNVRTRYENNNDEVSVQGSLITPPLIANYGFVSVDDEGDIADIGQYIEAPKTKSYNDYTAEEKDLDPANPTNTLILHSDNIREVWACSGGGAISTCAVDSMIDGTSDSTFTPVNVYNALGAGTINGMFFPDLRGSNRTYGSGQQYRVRAKGIGTVLTLSNGRPSVAIYYRVNGATGGSLAGTPFEAGQPMDGIWF